MTIPMSGDVQSSGIRTLVKLLIAAGLVLPLAGCSGHGLVLSARDGDIPACELGHDPIPVESLNTQRKATCKLADVSLLFPDGALVYIDRYAYSGAASSAGAEGKPGKAHTYYSVGVYGYVVAESNADCGHVRIWGSREGRARVIAAFGNKWACP